MKIVGSSGLYLHLRIGPYVCAEWNFGYYCLLTTICVSVFLFSSLYVFLFFSRWFLLEGSQCGCVMFLGLSFEQTMSLLRYISLLLLSVLAVVYKSYISV